MPLSKVGGPGHVFVAAGPHDLYGIQPDKQAVWRFHNGQWTKVGGPAHQIATARDQLFGVAPNGHEVYHYSGHGEQWHKVGDGIHTLIGGGHHMYGLSSNGDIHKFKDNAFHKIGGPGHKFVATGDIVVGIAPGKDSCHAYYDNQWHKVGGPIDDLIAGNGKVYGIAPGSADIYEWHVGHPDKWAKVGGPGRQFVVTEKGLYGLTPNGDAIYHYDGSAWHKVADGAKELVGHGHHLYAVAHHSGDLHRLD